MYRSGTTNRSAPVFILCLAGSVNRRNVIYIFKQGDGQVVLEKAKKILNRMNSGMTGKK
ncbi:hypothetical protein Cabys_995 [Caldithrix abyssi DSM 13497]|uniref:Uncharacterized protein n=1 Tax=Caldithrix abyssi DSM 13497 TaxID=880073 RepID=A0A1J1C6W1_CALAY|nr:hypothetical protein Cabys_995 [Caldithrix abyssi DSM 13497]